MVTDNMLTRADLDALPDNGLRHELIDGAFIMSPAPGRPHQRMAFALARVLHAAAEDSEFEVLIAPFDVVLGASAVEPDIVMAPRAAFTDRDLPQPPTLVVEVRSPTTAWLDEGRKRTLYEEHGVGSYWLVDPAGPAITVLGLREGAYEEVACATGDQTIRIDAPVAVLLNPANLAAG